MVCWGEQQGMFARGLGGLFRADCAGNAFGSDVEVGAVIY